MTTAIDTPSDLRQRLRQYGQEHVLAGWDRLDNRARGQLLDQLRHLDLEQLRRLHARRNEPFEAVAAERIAPVRVDRLDSHDRAKRTRGEEALRGGEVAVMLVAGGQGSRLGFEHPKGLFPIGPVTNKPLFQIHAEKVLALRRRYGRPVPFLIMTSDATHEETVDFFREQKSFGLPPDEVHFFQQGTMPAVDLETGALLLESPGRLFTSPNGHGGMLPALVESGLLERLQRGGFRQIFYFQVDNPLVKVADPLFLGHHLQADAEVSSKIVPKESATDKLGNIILLDGRCNMIEYSDLPKELGEQRDAQGRLRIWAGSPAIHLFAVDFLARVAADQEKMPFHLARKVVPYVDAQGRPVQPEKPNALKFEKFIFDVLPLADRWTVVETSRREEFVPLKNASGPDSPPVVRQALSRLAADWLTAAGVSVPRDAAGEPTVALEISPLFALDAEELAGKLAKLGEPVAIDGPRYFG